MPHSLIYFGIVIFFIYFKLSSMLLGIHDPFLPFENLFCAIFMGGIWDALAHVLANGGWTALGWRLSIVQGVLTMWLTDATC